MPWAHLAKGPTRAPLDLTALLTRGHGRRPMPPELSACLDENVMSALLAGTLAPEQRDAAEAHVSDCESCRAELAALLSASTDSDVSQPLTPFLPPEPGTVVGRYV